MMLLMLLTDLQRRETYNCILRDDDGADWTKDVPRFRLMQVPRRVFYKVD